MTIQKPELVNVESKIITGISVRTNNKIEFSSDARLPILWSDFHKSYFGKKLKPSSPYGVYHKYESDLNGNYNVLAGVEDPSSSEDLETVTIEFGNYLKFSNQGPMPGAVIDLWGYIWEYFENSPEYERSYSTDFEHYIDEEHVDIYIAVK